MVKNNHSCDNRSKLDSLLRSDVADRDPAVLESVLAYARSLAKFENALVVVSDMAAGRSHIIAGGFARNLDIGDYSREESIWERRILSLMSPEEQERKYIAGQKARLLPDVETALPFYRRPDTRCAPPHVLCL